MPRFSVLARALENESSKFNSYKGELSTYSSKINTIKNSLPIHGDAANQIKAVLSKSKNNVAHMSDAAQSLSQSLKNVCALYVGVEKNTDSSQINDTLGSSGEISGNIFGGFFSSMWEWIKNFFKDDKKVPIYEVDSIVFDDDGSYGGDQGAAKNLKKNSEERKEIEEIVKRNMADCDMPNDMNFSKYLQKMNNEGCGYVALVNTIFVYYQGREQDFEKTFGYSMYNQKGDLNYNLLIADIYSSTDNRENGRYNKYGDYNRKEDGSRKDYDPWNDNTGNGSNANKMQDCLDIFLSDKGFKSKVNHIWTGTMTASKLKDYTMKGESVLLSYSNGNIYELNGKLHQHIGSHRMVITGITEDGKYIVSSWGEKFIIDPKEGNCRLYTVKYSDK